MQGFPPPPDKQVNRLNALWGVPHNRWSYQNMRRLLPTAPIACAETAVALEREIVPNVRDLTISREDGSPANFDTFLHETFTDSLVVIHGGKVVHESYLNGMTASQPHQMMSCTKSFVGLLALIAIDEGHVTEATSVSDVIDELPQTSGFASAKFGQVLDMTNSLYFSEEYDDPQAHIHDYAHAVGLGPGSGADVASDNLYDFLATLPSEEGLAHGTTFHYQTPKTDVANLITCRVTGQSFETAMYERLWSKLGTTGETYLILDPNGIVVAGGGLNATSENLAKFAAMMLAGGQFNGRQVVPEHVIKSLENGGSKEAFLNGPDASGEMSNGHWSYRAQWWIRGTPGREAIMAIGVNGQWIYIDRSRDIAIVKQSSQPVAVADYFDTYTLNAFDAITDLVTGR